YDLSRQIDSCDLVIRCNEAKTLGVNSGTRTDILCVNNSGAPATRFIEQKSLQKNPRFPELAEIWFARPYPDCIEVSQKILNANNLSDISIQYLSTEFNERACDQLKMYGSVADQPPSTGFLAFRYILEQAAFDDFDKYIFGFTFNMWHGHPEQAEMKVIESYCKNRNDFFFIPTESFWKLKRRVKAAYFYNLVKRIQNKFHVL
ncbi:MAG: glycosyltransferase family 29 protein, partial [Saprospiraceae bacterium]